MSANGSSSRRHKRPPDSISRFARPQPEIATERFRALFRALLLAIWHDVSDVRLPRALDGRTSFRRFCGFSTQEPTPERTAFVCFRGELVRLGLDRVMFAVVTRQFDRCCVVVPTGTLVDATLIPSASLKDDEARWAERSMVPAASLLE